jgi:prophage regulatory protein
MSERLLTRSEVEARVGLKRSAIYERMAAGVFPRPVPDELSRAVRWVESEIDAYVAARIEARNMGSNMGHSRAA